MLKTIIARLTRTHKTDPVATYWREFYADLDTLNKGWIWGGGDGR